MFFDESLTSSLYPLIIPHAPGTGGTTLLRRVLDHLSRVSSLRIVLWTENVPDSAWIEWVCQHPHRVHEIAPTLRIPDITPIWHRWPQESDNVLLAWDDAPAWVLDHLLTVLPTGHFVATTHALPRRFTNRAAIMLPSPVRHQAS